MEEPLPSLSERLRRARLCVLATSAVARISLVEAVREALAGGADMIQLREKLLPDEDVAALARALRPLCRGAGAILVVNDRIGVASAVGADGVHLGQEDGPVAAARLALGPEACVGVSTHDVLELERAITDGADYVGVGAVFPTATKGRAVPVSGPEALAPLAVRAEGAGVPAFAIGGITPANAREVLAAGIGRLAVSAGVLAADSPRAATRALRAALDEFPL